MESCPDIDSLATQPPAGRGSGGDAADTPVLESPAHLKSAPHATGPGWDPYEVWWTQVRAVQMARASKVQSSPPIGQHVRRERIRSSRLAEAARNIVLTAAHSLASLKVRGVLHSIGYRRQS
jgi:hypothetical protein